MDERAPAPTTGVILAAGFGSRLGGDKENALPKPLIPVLGKPVILRTLASLEVAGCRKTVIVLGFQAERIRAAIEDAYEGSMEIVYALNDRYDLANGLSALAAKPYVNGVTFLLTMADHVLDDALMKTAGPHSPPENGATLLVDYNIGGIFDMDDATKVREEDGRIMAIGKNLNDFNCIDTGVFVCTGGLLEALSEVFEAKGDVSLSDGVQALTRSGKMTVLDIGDSFWQDVDTPDMLRHAEQRLKGEA